MIVLVTTIAVTKQVRWYRLPRNVSGRFVLKLGVNAALQ